MSMRINMFSENGAQGPANCSREIQQTVENMMRALKHTVHVITDFADNQHTDKRTYEI